MELNEKQIKARNIINWPLLIIAGAGSGKTATLTARVEYMIKEKWISPNSIMCVTFTNKAANEMKSRISGVLWINSPRNIYSTQIPLIGTFHSIWVFLLKENIEKLWYAKEFIIYDENDKISLIKNIIKEELKLSEKEYPPRQIAYYISNAKNSLITPEWYWKQVDNPIKDVVHNVYKIYEKRLKENNSLDFDDILLKTLSILEIPEVLENYQEKYKYIMVDEYQDTNMPQYKIINLLASKYRNLCVVGDDWQSIYSWRWADMRNIINFKKDYREACEVKLEQNYRSTSHIIESANKLIKNNKSALKKEMWTNNHKWEKISYIEAYDEVAEANNIAEDIINYGLPYKKNLILYRTNSQSRQIEEALLHKNIPYRVIWWFKFYDRKEIKDLLAYLRIIYNPNDVINFKRIINVPSRKIWIKTLSILDMYKNNFSIPYTEVLANIEEVQELWPSAKNSIKWFYEIYKDLEKYSGEITVAELLEKIIRNIWYEDYLRLEFTPDEVLGKLDNIDELISLATNYNWMEPKDSLGIFLEDISLITDAEKKDDRDDYVTMMTIHTAKWLEADNVFIAWCEDWIFPHIRSINNPNELEEERRLMYVAMTRARERLHISRARERYHFGNYVSNPESRFISEIPEEFLEREELKNNNFFTSFDWWNNSNFSSKNTSSSRKKIANIRDNDVNQFSLGDKVKHHRFWTWIITNISWENAEIAFGTTGIKKMNLRIAPIEKI